MQLFFTRLVGIIVLGLTVFNLNAQLTFSLTPSTTWTNIGETITVDVVVTDFTDVVSLQASINWDESVLSFVSIDNITDDLSGFNNNSFGTPDTDGFPENTVSVSWLDPNIAGVTLPDGSILFTITLMAIADGYSQISFSNSPIPIEIIDGELNYLEVNLEDAGVIVGDFLLTIEDINANQGNQICLDVTTTNFVDILGLQFSLDYDPAVLQFVSVGNFNLDGLNGNLFGLPPSGTAPGTITMSWLDNNLEGVTLPDNTILFEMCFEVIGTANTTIDFSNSPIGIQVTDADENSVNFTGEPGTITILDNPAAGDFLLTIEDVNANQGDQICLDVTTTNFVDILGLQFSIDYDPAVLQFVSVGNFNLNGLTESLFGLPPNSTVPGTITLSWLENSLMGIDLPDNTILFEMCFTVTGNTTSDVTFSSSPTGIEVTDADEQPVDFNGEKGTVTLPDNPAAGDFLLTIEHVNVDQGEQVCLEVTTTNFIDILGMQFSINYDPEILHFESVGNFNLDGLNANYFSFPPSGTAPGTITMSWLDNSLEGVTLPDNTILFEMCFEVIGNSNTTIDFSNSPTPIEITDMDENDVLFNSESGNVFIGLDGFNLMMSAVNLCPPDDGNDFCVAVTTYGFEDILGMQFSMQYDASKMQINSFGSFNLDGLHENSFGTGTPGVVTLSWLDNNLQGISLPDGTTIFEMCFTALVDDAPVTIINFVDSPSSIEITDGNEQQIEFNGIGSVVDISCDIQPLQVSLIEVVDVDCFGEATGAIEVNVTGGLPPFSYNWNVPGDGDRIESLEAGDYNLTVTAADGQNFTSTYTVSQPASALTVNNVQIVEPECNGDNNGALEVLASGGTGTFSYNWTPSGLGDTATPSSLEAGFYRVTIIDENNCEAVSNLIQITEPVTLEISSFDTNDIYNNDDGTISVETTGGTAPLSYAWSGPQSPLPDAAMISNLSESGTYCVTVTDENDCTTSGCTELILALRISEFSITKACPGMANGAIQIAVIGGVPDYTYEWQELGSDITLSTTESIQNISPGSYSVTVTDMEESQVAGNFEVTTYPGIATTATITPATNGNDGAIQLDIFGGAPDYIINWDNGSSFPNNVGLTPGTYCATITDANTCTIDTCFQVPAAPISGQIEATDVACNGDSDGTISITVQGGNPPYTITSNGSEVYTGSDNEVLLEEFGAGNYTIVVRDAEDNTFSETVIIEMPEPITFDFLLRHDTNEPGCTGTISLSIEGGTPPYNVDWDSGNLSGTTIINLCAGTYTPTIYDADNCIITGEGITINTFEVYFEEVINASCPESSDGAIYTSVSGGVSPYSYQWLNMSGTVIATSQNLVDIPTGTYQVRVSEGSGNTLTNLVEIESSSNLEVFTDILSNYNGYAVSCPNATDGAITATTIDGFGNTLYEWTQNEEIVGTNAEINDLPVGTYELVATDEAGCTQTQTVTLESPSPINITGEVEDVSCPGAEDGSVMALASGGVEIAYFYIWDNGTVGNKIINAPAGAYTVTVTDANDCTATATFEVTDLNILSATIETTAALDGNCDGEISVEVTGGTAPFFYNWIGLEVNPVNSTVADLCPGTYQVQVLDAAGCRTDTLIATVENDDIPCMEHLITDVATGFTPDGDGINDRFDPLAGIAEIGCQVPAEDASLAIINRWGELIYDAPSYEPWDGRYPNGKLVPNGVYFFVLRFELNGMREVREAVHVFR